MNAIVAGTRGAESSSRSHSCTKWAFGSFTIDLSARMLTHRGAPQALNGKAFDLLAIFVQSAGTALHRDELYHQLWPEGFVEDGNLTQNIYLVRRALAGCEPEDDSIQTVPRFGYRFRPTVRPLDVPATPLPRRWYTAAVLAIALLAATGLRIVSGESLSATAHESFALGQYHLQLRSIHELYLARDYFEETVRRAPNAAAGYAGLASADALLAEYEPDGTRAQRDDVDRAKRERDAALLRDPRDADALSAAGFIAYRWDQNPALGLTHLHAALSANAEHAQAHHWLGVLLLAQGSVQDAIAHLEAAHRIAPTSEVYARWLARAYVYDNRPREAIALVNEALALAPNAAASHLILAHAQEELGNLRAAQQTLRNLVAADPYEKAFVVPDEARLALRLNRASQNKLLAKLDARVTRGEADPFEAALFYYTAGKTARANRLLRSIRAPFEMLGLDRNDPRLMLAASRG